MTNAGAPSTDEATEMVAFWAAWQTLLHVLPAKHRVLLQGPNLDGTWSVGIVAKTTPTQQVVGTKGQLVEAVLAAADEVALLQGQE